MSKPTSFSSQAAQSWGVESAFDRTEYADRLNRTRRAMKLVGLDVLLVFHQEHMYYLTGYDQIGYWVYQVLIVPANESPMTAIVRKVDEVLIRQPRIIEDVRTWSDESTLSPAILTANVLDELGLLAGRRIGIEKRSHALLAADYEVLKEALSAAEIVDGSSVIMNLRLIKSPAEIACMRRAGQIMDAAVREGFVRLRDGARECDVAAGIMEAMYAAGGDPPAVHPPMGGGPRTLSQTHGAATTRVMRTGEPFLLEVGASWKRYHSVCMRMASVGPPSKRLQAMHDAIQASTTEGLSHIRPGIATAEIAERMGEILSRFGFPNTGRHRGYGIGLGYPPTWLDSLRIKTTDPSTLQAGMTFMLFEGLTDEDSELSVWLGDPVLVTDTGYESLTTLSRDIAVRQ